MVDFLQLASAAAGFAPAMLLMYYTLWSYNFPRFQKKIDTAFYALALGLGIGSTVTFANVYIFLLDVESVGPAEVGIVAFLGVLFVLMHGSTTTIIGIGVARGDVKGYFPEALLIHVLFGLLYESFFAIDIIPPPANALGLGGATAVVVYAYAKIHRTSIPALVKDANRLAARK